MRYSSKNQKLNQKHLNEIYNKILSGRKLFKTFFARPFEDFYMFKILNNDFASGEQQKRETILDTII